MKREEEIKYKYGNKLPFTVPDNYFRDLNNKILGELPPYQSAPPQKVLSKWQRLKPYVYLAAMFCGIWLMMKVFHNVSMNPTLDLDNPPEALVQLIESDEFDMYDFYGDPEFVMEEEIGEEYNDINDFENDFGYDFKPEYAALNPLKIAET